MYPDDVIELLGKTYEEEKIKEKYNMTFEQYMYSTINNVWEKLKNENKR